MVMFFNPEEWGEERTRRTHARPNSPAGMQAANPGTPPVDVIASEAGLLARGSARRSVFPGRTQWHGGPQLAAYSCGGSAGLAPASRL